MLTILSKSQVVESLAEERAASIPVHSVCFSANSQYIGAGSADGFVKIWNLKTHSLDLKSYSHEDSVYSVAWNISDTLLASGCMSGGIALHAINKSTPVANLGYKQHV